MNQITLTCINILKYAIKNQCTVKEASEHYKKRSNFISDYKRRNLDKDLSIGKINKKQYDEFLNLYNQFFNKENIKKSSLENKPIGTPESELDLYDELLRKDYDVSVKEKLFIQEVFIASNWLKFKEKHEDYYLFKLI